MLHNLISKKRRIVENGRPRTKYSYYVIKNCNKNLQKAMLEQKRNKKKKRIQGNEWFLTCIYMKNLYKSCNVMVEIRHFTLVSKEKKCVGIKQKRKKKETRALVFAYKVIRKFFKQVEVFSQETTENRDVYLQFSYETKLITLRQYVIQISGVSLSGYPGNMTCSAPPTRPAAVFNLLPPPRTSPLLKLWPFLSVLLLNNDFCFIASKNEDEYSFAQKQFVPDMI